MLLTIAIPTYNRSDCLRHLLGFLHTELATVQDSVQVLVSDNASTDATSAVIAEFTIIWPGLLAQRQAQNIGADGNFCSCVDQIQTPYFWILGDDDQPRKGAIAELLTLLRAQKPDLVYMRSNWVSSVADPSHDRPLGTLRWRMMERLAFAKEVHVWFTFISGMVVNGERLTQTLDGHSIKRYAGTNLVQLGWVFPLLASGSRFLLISDPCVLATKGNTGGYALLTVFGANFPSVARAAFGKRSAIARMLVARAIRQYLPGLIWSSRVSSAKLFSQESPWPAMRQALGSQPLFWALLLPIGRLPRPLAVPVVQGWRVVARLERDLDRLIFLVRSMGLRR